MISIKVNTNSLRKTVTAELNDTVISIFDKLGVNVSGSMVNINGTILKSTELQSNFQFLGVKDGEEIRLNCVVKADGGIFKN